MARAYTRQPSRRIGECELSFIARAPIDRDRLRDQHAAYERTLLHCGLEVHRFPALPDSPDGVFVEDMAVLLGEHALLARSASAARSAESASVAQRLGADFELATLPSGTLDGGDVLRIGKRLYVGQSARTDANATQHLARWAERLGYSVQPVLVHGCLHLKTAATFAGNDASGRTLIILNPEWIDARIFADHETLAVHSSEPFAANTLRIGERLLIAAGQPRLAEALQQRGFAVVALDISELQKAEAGLTCLSLIDAR
jgi:dimethylargininase